MVLSLLYITCKTLEEGRHIAHTLLEERLIACANLIPETLSLYHWERSIQENKEIVMLVKTVPDLVAHVRLRIKQLHSYTCPLILEMAVSPADIAIASWIKESVLIDTP